MSVWMIIVLVEKSFQATPPRTFAAPRELVFDAPEIDESSDEDHDDHEGELDVHPRRPEEPERVRPSGKLAEAILGAVDDFDGAGQSGLELQYDDLLAGTPGEQLFERGPDLSAEGAVEAIRIGAFDYLTRLPEERPLPEELAQVGAGEHRRAVLNEILRPLHGRGVDVRHLREDEQHREHHAKNGNHAVENAAEERTIVRTPIGRRGGPKSLLDEDGKKRAVVLHIKDYERLLEDLRDLTAVAERRHEPSISLAELKQRLRADGLLRD
jgi:hypothetical protein